jgi:hypothetical protein
MELRPTEMQELPEHWGPNVAFGMPIPMNSVGIDRPASTESTQVLARRIPNPIYHPVKEAIIACV